MNLADLKAEFNAGMGHSLEVALQNIHDRITAEINAERDKLASDIAGVDVAALQKELAQVRQANEDGAKLVAGLNAEIKDLNAKLQEALKPETVPAGSEMTGGPAKPAPVENANQEGGNTKPEDPGEKGNDQSAETKVDDNPAAHPSGQQV